MTSFTTAMLTRTTEDPCIGTSAPYITQSSNTITLTPQNCEHSVVLVRATPVSTMVPREFIYTAPFNITEDTYISAYNLRAGYKLGDDASGKMFEYQEVMEDTPFFIKNETSSSGTIRFTPVCTAENLWYVQGYFEMSTDKVNWTSFTVGTGTAQYVTTVTKTLPANGKVYLRQCSGNHTSIGGLGVDFARWIKITCNVNHSFGGNILSLLYGSSFNGQTEIDTTALGKSLSAFNHCFSHTFQGDVNLVSVANLVLPSKTVIPTHLYYYTFSGCTGLTTLPQGFLQVTALNTCTYSNMFEGCTGLTTVPANLLPCTTLSSNCYYGMFNGCTSLTTAPALPATTLAEYCYYQMFKNTALTTAPDLMATQLNSYCYYQMFYGASNLNYVKCMIVNDMYGSNTSPSYQWLYGVSATGTFVKNSFATWTQTGVSAVPTGWTVQTQPAGTAYRKISSVSELSDGDVILFGYMGQAQYRNSYRCVYGSYLTSSWVSELSGYGLTSSTYNGEEYIPYNGSYLDEMEFVVHIRNGVYLLENSNGDYLAMVSGYTVFKGSTSSDPDSEWLLEDNTSGSNALIPNLTGVYFKSVTSSPKGIGYLGTEVKIKQVNYSSNNNSSYNLSASVFVKTIV